MSYYNRRWTCISVKSPISFQHIRELKVVHEQYEAQTECSFTDIFVSTSPLTGETDLYFSIYSTELQFWEFIDILRDCGYKITAWYDVGPSHTGGIEKRIQK